MTTSLNNVEKIDSTLTPEITTFVPDECLNGKLDDATSFSYIALCAIALSELYPEDFDKNFLIETIDKIANHLLLPEQVQRSAFSILSCDVKPQSRPFLTQLNDSLRDISKTLQSIIKDLLLIPLKEGVYDSRYRVFLKYLCNSFDEHWEYISDYEKQIVEFVSHFEEDAENAEKEKKTKKRKIKKYAMIGAASVLGGTLLGLTGGLAAPLLVSGLGTIIGTSTTAVLGTVTGTYVIGSLIGAAGAGLGGYKMQKRVGDIEEFSFDEITNHKDFSLTIAITGWLTDKENDCIRPWLKMNHSAEQYVLRFETKHLLKVGNGLDYMLSVALSSAAGEALKYTLLSGILTAVMWPSAIIAASSIIDNPWSVCIKRAESAGHHLAEILLSRQQGRRPVTLIGYSIGARVIFYCLKELSERKNGLGIVEDVYLFGAPVSANSDRWMTVCKAVAGKIVNGYLKSDWLLKFVYRTASLQTNVAGLAPIEMDNRKIQNINLEGVIDGHLDYCTKLNDVLSFVGIKTYLNNSKLTTVLNC